MKKLFSFFPKSILMSSLFALLFVQISAISHATKHDINNEHNHFKCEICVFSDSSKSTTNAVFPYLKFKFHDVIYSFADNRNVIYFIHNSNFSRAPPIFL